MDKTLIDILRKLIAEQGRETLLNTSKCKAFLADYTKNEYKRESRLLLQALEAGVQREIDVTQELAICKKQQGRLLHEDYGMDEKVAADVVNTLAIVLRGDTAELEAQAAIECGMKYLKNKDYDKAIEEINEAVRLDPNYAQAYSGRGYAYEMKDQYDRAIDDYNEAIRLDPNCSEAYMFRGSACLKKGQYDYAIRDCNEAIKLNPNNTALAYAYLNRGDAYIKKGQYDQAINDYSEIIKLKPDDAVAFFIRGDAYSKKGRYDQAIKDFEKALSIDPNSELVKQNLEKAKQMLRKTR